MAPGAEVLNKSALFPCSVGLVFTGLSDSFLYFSPPRYLTASSGVIEPLSTKIFFNSYDESKNLFSKS